MALKDRVLDILEAHRGEYISGETMSETLGVTRAGVWKAVKALREQGCPIESHPHLGYTLGMEDDFLTVSGIKKALGEDDGAREIIIFDSVNSTNTKAMELAAEGSPNGTVVLAREQTAGRGRLGRSFFAPKDKGLYMSIILRPNASPEEAQMFTIAAAVAVCRVIEHLTTAKPQIKWVNDIFIQGKKVCGILTEATAGLETNTVDQIILGIGINISAETKDFPKELRAVATSLFPQGAIRNTIAAEVIKEVESLIKNPQDPQLIEDYKSRCLVLGREIQFSRQGQEYRGTALDINNRGHLIVDTPQGRQTLTGGEITLRSDNFIERK